MKHFNATKYRISMLVVMVMLLQMLMPVVGDVVWAEGDGDQPVLETEETEAKEVEEPSEQEKLEESMEPGDAEKDTGVDTGEEEQEEETGNIKENIEEVVDADVITKITLLWILYPHLLLH